MECWECPLRCYYCRIHDLLCEFLTFPSGEQSNLTSCSNSRWQLSRCNANIKKTKIILKKIILLTIETGTLTGICILFESPMWLTMFISAIIGIASFILAISPGDYNQTYYQVPVCIIGKVYANSMLVLINSRMVLGSGEIQTPSRVTSVLRFDMPPANPKDSAIEADNGGLAVDTRAGAGPLESSEPEAV